MKFLYVMIFCLWLAACSDDDTINETAAPPTPQTSNDAFGPSFQAQDVQNNVPGVVLALYDQNSDRILYQEISNPQRFFQSLEEAERAGFAREDFIEDYIYNMVNMVGGSHGYGHGQARNRRSPGSFRNVQRNQILDPYSSGNQFNNNRITNSQIYFTVNPTAGYRYLDNQPIRRGYIDQFDIHRASNAFRQNQFYVPTVNYNFNFQNQFPTWYYWGAHTQPYYYNSPYYNPYYYTQFNNYAYNQNYLYNWNYLPYYYYQNTYWSYYPYQMGYYNYYNYYLFVSPWWYWNSNALRAW